MMIRAMQLYEQSQLYVIVALQLIACYMIFLLYLNQLRGFHLLTCNNYFTATYKRNITNIGGRIGGHFSLTLHRIVNFSMQMCL